MASTQFSQQIPQFPFKKQIDGQKYNWVTTEKTKSEAERAKVAIKSRSHSVSVRVLPEKLGNKTWYPVYARR